MLSSKCFFKYLHFNTTHSLQYSMSCQSYRKDPLVTLHKKLISHQSIIHEKMKKNKQNTSSISHPSSYCVPKSLRRVQRYLGWRDSRRHDRYFFPICSCGCRCCAACSGLSASSPFRHHAQLFYPALGGQAGVVPWSVFSVGLCLRSLPVAVTWTHVQCSTVCVWGI